MENDKDTVIKLRWFVTNVHSDSPVIPPMQRLAAEAADEIERMRVALANISCMGPHYVNGIFEDHAAFAIRIKAAAKAALQPQS